MRQVSVKPVPRLRFRELIRPGASGLVGAGYILDKRPRQEVQNRTLSVYALVYLIEGGGYYRDERGERRVSAGDCLVLFPGLTHSYYRGDSPRWSEAFLMFTGGIFRALEAERVLDRALPILRPGLGPRLLAAFEQSIGAFVREEPVEDALAAARVHLLLTELAAAHRTAGAGGSGSTTFAQRASALMEANLAEPLDPRTVARDLKLSYERFRKRFAEEVGVPPGRYRVLRRVDQAKTLLAEGRLPIKEIADRLGYCDLYFFARQFKRETGQTPGEFRRLV